MTRIVVTATLITVTPRSTMRAADPYALVLTPMTYPGQYQVPLKSAAAPPAQLGGFDVGTGDGLMGAGFLVVGLAVVIGSEVASATAEVAVGCTAGVDAPAVAEMMTATVIDTVATTAAPAIRVANEGMVFAVTFMAFAFGLDTGVTTSLLIGRAPRQAGHNATTRRELDVE